MDKKDSIDAAGGRQKDRRAAFLKMYAAIETFLQLDMPEGCLTPAAAATFLGCTKQNLDSLENTGKLHPIRQESCGRKFYSRDEIVELLFQKRDDENYLHFYRDSKGDVRSEFGDLIATKEEYDKRLRELVRRAKQHVRANPDVTAGEILDKKESEDNEVFEERRRQALRHFSLQGKEVPPEIKKLFAKKKKNYHIYNASMELHDLLRPPNKRYSVGIFFPEWRKLPYRPCKRPDSQDTET